jgi:hypothetical protein
MLKIQTAKTRHKIQRELLQERLFTSKKEVFSFMDDDFLLPASIAQGALFMPLARWAHSHPAPSIDIAITRTLQKVDSPLHQRIATVFGIVNSPAALNAVTCTALIGLSRIYQGKHWASDVLGGYLLGGSLLTGSLRLYLSIRRAPLTIWRRRLFR